MTLRTSGRVDAIYDALRFLCRGRGLDAASTATPDAAPIRDLGAVRQRAETAAVSLERACYSAIAAAVSAPGLRADYRRLAECGLALNGRTGRSLEVRLLDLGQQRQLRAGQPDAIPASSRPGPRRDEHVTSYDALRDELSMALREVAYIIDDMERQVGMRTSRKRLERAELGEYEWLVHWSLQHRYYAFIATPVYSLRNDLVASLRLHHAHGDAATTLQQYIHTSLYHFAMQSRAYHDFKVEIGGEWMLGNVEREVAVADAIWMVELHSGLSQLEQSLLRTLLRESDNSEPVTFAERLHSRPEADELVHKWEQWILSCACRTDQHQDCTVHAVIDACQIFVAGIEEDWQEIETGFHRRDSYYLPPSVEDLFDRYRRVGSGEAIPSASEEGA